MFEFGDKSEVLPPIVEFRGDYFFLSNFYVHTMEYDGNACKTSEHAYQAAKFDYPHKGIILSCATPNQTKTATRKFLAEGHGREGWKERRIEVMCDVLVVKFSDPVLERKLLETGERELIEGNTWGDVYWGMVFKGGKWVGENNLGKILMALRSEKRKSNERA